jgi:hypothetical protein
MRLIGILLSFMLLFPDCAGIRSSKFSVLAYRQKVIAGAAPDFNSSRENPQYQYYLFLLPPKNTKDIRIDQLCLNEQWYGADLEALGGPYIAETVYGPEGSRRDTLLSEKSLPAFIIHLRKADPSKGAPKAVCAKNELFLQLNIGKATVNKFTDLPDRIMP